MYEKDQLDQLINEYDNVSSRFRRIFMALRGAIHVYDKAYSETNEFLAWIGRIRVFLRHSFISN